MKSILFLLGTYPGYGGVEKVTTRLANAFHQQGNKVSIVSFKQPHPELAYRELSKDIRLFQLTFPVFSLSNIRKLRQIIKENQIELILNQWCVPFYVTGLLTCAIQHIACKVIAVHHNLPSMNARIKSIEQQLEMASENTIFKRGKFFLIKFISRLSLRYSYDNSNAFVVLSPSYIPVLHSFILQKNNDRIYSIGNFVTMPDESQNRPVKEKEIIYVGRIENIQKRINRILDVWKEIQDQYPDWKLTIVGDGPDKELLQKKMQEEQLLRVAILGFTNPEPYYKRASILLLTSEYEGFGLVIAEGMSYGVVPVVYGSYKAVYDIIDHGKNGFITSMPYSKEETLNYVKKLMDNDALREQLALEAKEKSKAFSLESIVGQWEDLFEKLEK